MRKYNNPTGEITEIRDMSQNTKDIATRDKKKMIIKDIVKEDEDLAEKIKEKMGKGYINFRTSKEFDKIIQMLLNGEKLSEVCAYLRENDPEHFRTYEDKNLQRNLGNLRDDLSRWVGEDSDITDRSGLPISALDYAFLKYRDRPFVVIAMMEKAILVQENRLDRALKIESNKKFLMDAANKELTTYFSLLKELGTYKKLIGLPDDGVGRFHQVTEGFTNMLNYYKSLTPENRDEFKQQLRQLAAANERKLGLTGPGVRDGDAASAESVRGKVVSD